jgi:acyl carrier protein
MDLAWVLDRIEEATQSLPGTITADTALEDTEVWDSMSMLMFAGLVEEEVGVELTGDDITSCRTPTDLLDAVRRHLAR